MKNIQKYKLFAILILMISASGPVLAQRPVRMGPASTAEIKKARAAAEAYPDSLEAYEQYIYAMGPKNPLLATQYKAWIKKYPQKVTIPLAFGTVYYNAEMPQAREYLLKAAGLDPKNAKIWNMLSADARIRGQDSLSTKYLQKATLADSSDADYAFYYLVTFENGDPAVYRQKVLEFAKRFPSNKRGAQALYWIGVSAANLNDKISHLEKLRKLYPPKEFAWSGYGMEALADAYLQTDPEKAVKLINEMGEGKNWNLRKQVAESLIKAQKLERDRNYKDAVIELGKIKLLGFDNINEFITLKLAALQEKAGDVKASYDSLAMKFAMLPTDEFYAALELYGEKTGRDKEQVDKDIQKIRNSAATTAYPFELGLYTGNGKLNLKDLRGKVVLLTFWFPACSPCRAEFPHFQSVIDKFKNDDVVYVGINVDPEQDPYVTPFLKNSKYSFIPLRGSQVFAAKNYGVQGEPKNFLIDKDGKIIFKDFRIDQSNHRSLELMISSLLRKEPEQIISQNRTVKNR